MLPSTQAEGRSRPAWTALRRRSRVRCRSCRSWQSTALLNCSTMRALMHSKRAADVFPSDTSWLSEPTKGVSIKSEEVQSTTPRAPLLPNC